MHEAPDKETVGAIRAQRDWARLVGPVGLYKGGLGAPYSFMRVTVPECLPDRLEIISYANEFAFLYDGNSYLCIFEDWVLISLVQMLWRTSIRKRYATCFEWTLNWYGTLTLLRVARVIDKSSMSLVTAYCHQA